MNSQKFQKIELNCGTTAPRGFTGIIQWSNGTISWFLNGEYHREDGPAIEATSQNFKAWFTNGKRHRIDGPAIEAEDYKAWFINGLRHRTDGPAVVDKGCNIMEWWLDGVQYTSETEWKEALIK